VGGPDIFFGGVEFSNFLVVIFKNFPFVFSSPPSQPAKVVKERYVEARVKGEIESGDDDGFWGGRLA
jgi:hypothetical protein